MNEYDKARELHRMSERRMKIWNWIAGFAFWGGAAGLVFLTVLEVKGKDVPGVWWVVTAVPFGVTTVYALVVYAIVKMLRF